MLIKTHWTPRYIKDRFREYLFRKRFPDAPWLTPDAIHFLDTYLTRDKSGMELGSGRSTLWIAKKCMHLVSIESDSAWYSHIQTKLAQHQIGNVNYIFSPLLRNEDAKNSSYLKPLLKSKDDSFDFILVDGDYRDEAAVMAVSKLKSGGLLIVDNANWFLPSNTKSPSSIHLNEKCKTSTWEEFNKQTEDWKRQWTSNGITDTVFFFKP